MEDINAIVHEAYEVIQKGGVILYPTDTVWGLGCDATNDEAIQRVFEIKKRAENKSMICLVNGDRLLYQVFKKIPQVAFDILDCAERPTTLILDHPTNVSPKLIAEDQSMGIRLVNTPFCYKLIERMKRPLVSTSANVSGAPTPTRFSDIDETIKKQVDFIVPLEQEKVCKNASTIIKLTEDAQVKIIRK